MIWIIGRG